MADRNDFATAVGALIKAARWARNSIPSNANLNTYDVPGFYPGNGSNIANRPSSDAGNLEVMAQGSIITQRWTTLAMVPQEFLRRRYGGNWTAWADPILISQQGRGVAPVNSDLNTFITRDHNGAWSISSDIWSSYKNLPPGITASRRATLEVIAPDINTVTHRLHPSAGTTYYVRVMESRFGPVFTDWQAVDMAGGPTPDWVHWGDSLTDSDSLGADSWVSKLSTLTGRDHMNQGWSGQHAAQVAARHGGNPSLMTVNGGTIPASGTSVGVLSATAQRSMPVGEQQPTRQVPGTLGGRTGYLHDGGVSGEDGFFMPTEGTAATSAPGKQVFTPTGDRGLNRIATIWVGTNDMWSGSHTPAQIAYMIQQMIDHQSTRAKRVLVLTIPRRANYPAGTQPGEKVTAINAMLTAAFPTQIVDVAGYLMSDQAATDAGITYSADDLADIANGVTPRVFRLPADSVHFNALGASIIAPFVYAAAADRGWA